MLFLCPEVTCVQWLTPPAHTNYIHDISFSGPENPRDDFINGNLPSNGGISGDNTSSSTLSSRSSSASSTPTPEEDPHDSGGPLPKRPRLQSPPPSQHSLHDGDTSIKDDIEEEEEEEEEEDDDDIEEDEETEGVETEVLHSNDVERTSQLSERTSQPNLCTNAPPDRTDSEESQLQKDVNKCEFILEKDRCPPENFAEDNSKLENIEEDEKMEDGAVESSSTNTLESSTGDEELCSNSEPLEEKNEQVACDTEVCTVKLTESTEKEIKVATSDLEESTTEAKSKIVSCEQEISKNNENKDVQDSLCQIEEKEEERKTESSVVDDSSVDDTYEEEEQDENKTDSDENHSSSPLPDALTVAKSEDDSLNVDTTSSTTSELFHEVS